MSDTKQYKVLKAISFRSDRIERGSVIHATDEEAANIGVGEYLQPVDTQGAEATEPENTEVKTEEQSEVKTEEKTGTETGQETPGDAGNGDQPKTIKHTVTEEDLQNNPELVEAGVKVGDEIDIPEPTEPNNVETETKVEGEAEGGKVGDNADGSGTGTSEEKSKETQEGN